VLGNKLNIREGGYTLVEVTVAVTVMAIVGVTFIGIIAHYFVVISRSNAQTEMTIASQNLLRTTVDNIRFGDGVRQTNQIPDGNGPAGGWNTNNSNFVIIIAVPALDSTRNYIIDPSTGSPYMNELVYYKSGSTLYRRVLANPLATGNRLKTTCPQAAASPTCRADALLAEYVNTMDFTLYDQNGAITSAATNARSVKIDLNMQRNAPGDPITVKNSIRVTLRNRF
jgi:type II secretory pathway component PulJ